jgi:hypothetical protein
MCRLDADYLQLQQCMRLKSMMENGIDEQCMTSWSAVKLCKHDCRQSEPKEELCKTKPCPFATAAKHLYTIKQISNST